MVGQGGRWGYRYTIDAKSSIALRMLLYKMRCLKVMQVLPQRRLITMGRKLKSGTAPAANWKQSASA